MKLLLIGTILLSGCVVTPKVYQTSPRGWYGELSPDPVQVEPEWYKKQKADCFKPSLYDRPICDVWRK